MRKDKKIPRSKGRSVMKFHNKDRASLRSFKSVEGLDDLPVREAVRSPLWRGPNDFGDNTSIGGGSPKRKYIERMLDRNVGKSYNKFYKKMCELFKGNDRVYLDRIIEWNFIENGYGGFPLYSEYSVRDGIIIKNSRK
jgi:hypothetical protein